MRSKSINHLESELRKQVQKLFQDRKFDGIVRVITKYFSERRFRRKFDATFNFDLSVYANGGKKRYIVTLASLGPATAHSRKADREIRMLSEAYERGEMSKKELRKLMKQYGRPERFGGVVFAVHEHNKFTRRLRRIP
jgi:hypothetical protein